MKVKKFFMHIFFILASLLSALLLYLKIYFVNIKFEQLIYTMRYLEGTNLDTLYEGTIFVVLMGTIFYILLLLFLYVNNKLRYKCKEKLKEKKIVVFPIYNTFLFSIILFLFVIIVVIWQLNIFSYLKKQFSSSLFYSEYYVNPNQVEIVFPDKKRNLIYIFLESTETTIMSLDNGGGSVSSYIPRLEELALENINFSHTEKLGGGKVLNNTSWTIAGMVAQTAGISLNLPIGQNEYIGYTHFLPGVKTIGEILRENGYKNYLMMGSKATFAGRDEYFLQHGDYEIFDYYTAIEEKKISENYYVWWGLEDKKLFEYAKEKLTILSKESQPFNFTMLTVDTHFTDGYLDETCVDKPFDNQYANVFYCNSNMVYNFISWIKEQEFYENTTIILSGDHFSMQLLPIKCNDCQRIYNVFINSAINPINYQNRDFTTIDMFPTTLASLGVEIKGERLGLGTNLFSSVPTLSEELGFPYMNNEINKKSDFYNNYFLGDSYLEMLEELSE